MGLELCNSGKMNQVKDYKEVKSPVKAMLNWGFAAAARELGGPCAVCDGPAVRSTKALVDAGVDSVDIVETNPATLAKQREAVDASSKLRKRTRLVSGNIFRHICVRNPTSVLADLMANHVADEELAALSSWNARNTDKSRLFQLTLATRDNRRIYKKWRTMKYKLNKVEEALPGMHLNYALTYRASKNSAPMTVARFVSAN